MSRSKDAIIARANKKFGDHEKNKKAKTDELILKARELAYRPIRKSKHKKKKELSINDRLNNLSKKRMMDYFRFVKENPNTQTETIIRALEYKSPPNPSKAFYENLFATSLIDNKVKYDTQKIYFIGERFYIVDFYLKDYNTVIEIDGAHHYIGRQLNYDNHRTNELVNKCGVDRVIRVRNSEIMGDYKTESNRIIKEIIKAR